MDGKNCTRCGKFKSFSEYPKHNRSPIGYTSDCKLCRNALKKIYRENNKEKIRESAKLYQKKNKDKINTRLREYSKRPDVKARRREARRRREIKRKIANFHLILKKKLVALQKMRLRKRNPYYDKLKNNVWKSMKERCYNANHEFFYCYGGKGIRVCDEWHDFDNFFKWSISNGYRPGLTIDRIINDGNYCPENCRWVTMKVNNRNRSYVKLDTHKVSLIKRSLLNGEKAAALAIKYNVSTGTIYDVRRGRYWSDVIAAPEYHEIVCERLK